MLLVCAFCVVSLVFGFVVADFLSCVCVIHAFGVLATMWFAVAPLIVYVRMLDFVFCFVLCGSADLRLFVIYQLRVVLVFEFGFDCG